MNNSLRNYEVTTTTVDSDKPFTPEEDEVMEHLVKAMNKFVALPNQNKNAVDDFKKHIYNCQRILAMRKMKALFTDYFINED